MTPFYETPYHRGLLAEFESRIRAYLGGQESDGPNRSATIDKFNQYTGAPLGSPYCISGILFALHEFEKEKRICFDVPRTGSTQLFFQRTPAELRSNTPKVGSIVIWKSRIGSGGHAGYVTKVLSKSEIQTIEFNTSPNAKGVPKSEKIPLAINGEKEPVIREGDGCYEKTRKTSGSIKMKLIGYVNPFESILPPRLSAGEMSQRPRG